MLDGLEEPMEFKSKLSRMLAIRCSPAAMAFKVSGQVGERRGVKRTAMTGSRSLDGGDVGE